MTQAQIDYYYRMAERDRVFAFRKNNMFYGLATFLIGDEVEEKYIRDNPWSDVEDNPSGETIYIDQLLSNRKKLSVYERVEFWKRLKHYLKQRFPSAKRIRWNRYKNGKVHRIIKSL